MVKSVVVQKPDQKVYLVDVAECFIDKKKKKYKDGKEMIN